jgi:hypothetical protein
MGGTIMECPKILLDNYTIPENTGTSYKNTKFVQLDNYIGEGTFSECKNTIDTLIELNREYLCDYDTWLKFTMVLKSLDKNEKGKYYELWNEYSEKYNNGNYSKRNNNKIWNGLKDKNLSINYFNSICNLPAFSSHKHTEDDEFYNNIDYSNAKYIHKHDKTQKKNSFFIIIFIASSICL